MVVKRGRFRPPIVLFFVLATGVLVPAPHPEAMQSVGTGAPRPDDGAPAVTLVPAPTIRFPGDVDSNSPALWEPEDGQPMLYVLTSAAGAPSLQSGVSVDRLGEASLVNVDPWPAGGNWMEALVPDVDGTWYGFYHNEREALFCGGDLHKAIPRIGAMRSRDRGATWVDLGIILEAPPRSHDCDSPNAYFVGGVGDFSVMLDDNAQDLYIFFSAYLDRRRWQGVSVARLAWADRDAPVGKVMVWGGRAWLPPRAIAARGDEAEGVRWIYPAGVPIFPAGDSWHDEEGAVDAFWGPSIHWNTYLQRYVMLLNRAKDATWAQEGVYVAFAPRLDDPRLWTQPWKILDGGFWYPQVMGLERGTGSDKVAGQRARFFMSGWSEYLIQFSENLTAR